MDARVPQEQVDPILVPFLSETDEAKALSVLAEIVREHIEPRIGAVLNALLPESRGRDDVDAEGLGHDILLKLIARLYEARTHSTESFRDLASYVAAASRNHYHSYLRARYPERARLKNRIRYALDHEKGATVWKENGTLICGLGVSQSMGKAVLARERLVELIDGIATDSRDIAFLIVKLLRTANAPIGLDDLVDVIAEALHLGEVRTINVGSLLDCARVQIESASFGQTAVAADTAPDLELVWREIASLPLRQRVVLLLTLKAENGLDGFSLLGNAGVASLREISSVLEIGVVELAAMWDELPLRDHDVAQVLGITNQQVINLRKAARKRLSYRLQNTEANSNPTKAAR